MDEATESQGNLDSNNGIVDSSEEEGVVATFFNALHRNVRIFHVHPRTGQQLQVSQSIPPGRSGLIIANPSDVLIAYEGHGVVAICFWWR